MPLGATTAPGQMCRVVPAMRSHALPSVGVSGADSIALVSTIDRRTTLLSTSLCEPYAEKVRFKAATTGSRMDEMRSSVSLTVERKSMR